MPVVDAVTQARGVPDAARRLLVEAFSQLRVSISTRAGCTPPVVPTRGVPQGSVSGPEASKPAQEVILRIREASPA
eukprot:13325004-Heterocapsa_arctica.AAC.1